MRAVGLMNAVGLGTEHIAQQELLGFGPHRPGLQHELFSTKNRKQLFYWWVSGQPGQGYHAGSGVQWESLSQQEVSWPVVTTEA